jgi:hypothetical protein
MTVRHPSSSFLLPHLTILMMDHHLRYSLRSNAPRARPTPLPIPPRSSLPLPLTPLLILIPDDVFEHVTQTDDPPQPTLDRAGGFAVVDDDEPMKTTFADELEEIGERVGGGARDDAGEIEGTTCEGLRDG